MGGGAPLSPTYLLSAVVDEELDFSEAVSVGALAATTMREEYLDIRG